MLKIKDEYADVPCVQEYLVATAMVNGECKDIDDIAKHFHIPVWQAATILDSRSFSKVLDKVIAAKKLLGEAALFNRLVDIIHNGKPKAVLDAIQTLDYIIGQKGNKKKPLTININLQLPKRKGRKAMMSKPNDEPAHEEKSEQSVASDEEEIDYIFVEDDGDQQLINDDDEIVFVED